MVTPSKLWFDTDRSKKLNGILSNIPSNILGYFDCCEITSVLTDYAKICEKQKKSKESNKSRRNLRRVIKMVKYYKCLNCQKKGVTRRTMPPIPGLSSHGQTWYECKYCKKQFDKYNKEDN